MAHLNLDGIEAGVFDMDGVITQTAVVHAAAWKKAFDAFLKNYAQEHDQPFKPFDSHSDYLNTVDGKPRDEGIKSFLASRHITLPIGKSDDKPGMPTVYGIGNLKTQFFLDELKQNGVKTYPSTVKLIKAMRQHGLKVAVVTSSKNCTVVLDAAKIKDLFDVQVDGHTAEKEHLKGKPNADIFVFATKQLGLKPAQAVVFEDALAGVQAGHNGHFKHVVGLNREHDSKALKQHGADIVVTDIDKLTVEFPHTTASSK